MELRRWLWAALLLVLTLVNLAPVAMAQTAASGALAGTVTDPSGAVIPNVMVTVTSTDTNQVRTTSTAGDGSYKVGLLPPGNYSVRFGAPGFKSTEDLAVTVTVTETATLNQTLTVGAQTQEVTVQANVETLQTANSTLGTTLTSQTITDIPLSTRNYTNLLAFSAGANAGVNNANGLGKGTTTIAVNGSSTAQNNYQMDGVSIMGILSFGTLSENGSYAAVAIPNPDAIQEFKIQTSNYDASFGRNPGANVNVVTKSGTNGFHGTGFEFFRNTYLNAADFFIRNSNFEHGLPNKPGAFDQNQFGGTVGGPVKKDKLFFFVSYQETQQKNGNSAFGFSNVVLPPIPAGDRSTPAFQAALGNVVCSNRGLVGFGQSQNVANSAQSSALIQGAQVACNGSNINPVALALLNLKLPNGNYYIPSSGLVSPTGLVTGGTNAGYLQNVAIVDPAIFKEHQGVGNWDYVINSKNTLSGRYFYSTDPTQAPIGLGSTSTTPGIGLPGGALDTTFTYDNAVLKLTSILTNNVVNEVRATYELFEANDIPSTPFTNEDVGIQTLVPGINQLANVTVTSVFGIGTQQIQYQAVKPNQLIAADQLSWSHGKQTLRFGFEGERDETNWLFPGLSVVAETFPRFADFLLGLPGCSAAGAVCTASQNNGTNTSGTTGLTLASMSNSGGVTSNAPPGGIYHEYRVTAFDAFAQDDIKISPRLTINLGLRWEYDGAITDAQGHLTNLWPSLARLVIPGTTPCTGTLAGFVVPSNHNFGITQSYPANFSPNGVTFPCGPGNPASTVTGTYVNPLKQPGENNIPLDDFAPRLGFAWQPLPTSRLVLRGGAGFFYDRLPLGTIAMGVEQGPPYSNTVAQSGTNNFFATEAVPYAPAPLGWTPRYVNPNPGVGQLPSSSISNPIYPQGFTVPVVYEWNLSAQYEFKPKWVLEIGYVGSHGIHQQISHSINTPQLIPNAATGVNCGLPASPAQHINAAGCVTEVTAGNINFRAPLLGVATNQTETDTNGNTEFNSLQVTVRKQFSHGLTFQGAYTWSRAFITTYGSLNTDNPYANIYGLNPNYRPHRLVINYSWDIPSGNHEGIMGKIVNGWNLSGVTTLQDGTPLTVTNTAGTGFLGNGSTGRVQFCPGMGPGNLSTHGSLEQRLGNGVSPNGYFVNAGVICPSPTLASLGFPNTDGVASGFGNEGIGVVLGPGQFNWDMSLIKTTVVGGLNENATLQFRAEFFNAFNHPQFNNPAVGANAPNYGFITSTSVNPRLIQLALKYSF